MNTTMNSYLCHISADASALATGTLQDKCITNPICFRPEQVTVWVMGVSCRKFSDLSLDCCADSCIVPCQPVGRGTLWHLLEDGKR